MGFWEKPPRREDGCGDCFPSPMQVWQARAAPWRQKPGTDARAAHLPRGGQPGTPAASRRRMSSLLPTNEGFADRAIRLVLGVVLLALVFVGPKTLWGLVGLVPLVTGLIGSCPLYTLFGIRTCPLTGKPQG